MPGEEEEYRMYLRERGWEKVWALVNTVMNLRVP
jgi:hypothetical protein